MLSYAISFSLSHHDCISLSDPLRICYHSSPKISWCKNSIDVMPEVSLFSEVIKVFLTLLIPVTHDSLGSLGSRTSNIIEVSLRSIVSWKRKKMLVSQKTYLSKIHIKFHCSPKLLFLCKRGYLKHNSSFSKSTIFCQTFPSNRGSVTQPNIFLSIVVSARTLVLQFNPCYSEIP